MPKQTLKYDSKDVIPSGLQAFAKDDFTVEIWVNSDETAMAAELNPALERHRNTVLAEKQSVEDKYNALVRTASGEAIDNAKVLARNAELERNNVPAEDVEIAKTVKTLFPNASPAELKTQIETIQQKAQVGDTLTKEKRDSAIATALGYTNLPYFNFVLSQSDMLKDIQGDLIPETVLENDKPVTKVYANVKQLDGTIQKTLFSEYQKTNAKWAEHHTGLTLGGTKPQSDNQVWIQQPGGEAGGQPANELKAFIAANNKKAEVKPSPLSNAPQANTQGAGASS